MSEKNELKTYRIELDFLAGYLRYGHIELKLTDDEVEEYNSLDDYSSKEDFITDRCDIIPTDFSIDDYSFDIPDKL